MIGGRIKKSFEEIVRSKPGRRFQDFYLRRCRQRAPIRIALRIAAGVMLILSGIVLSMPPLVPGFIVTLSGLALIASQSRRVARWLDAIECWLRGLRNRV